MDKLELIKRNTVEIIGEEDLKKMLKDKKELSVYWGTMPTGSPHVSYFLPMMKIADFLRAGLKVKIMNADIHAALDGVSWNVLEHRFNYYNRVIKLMLKTLKVDTKKLKFVKGSDFELKPKYFNDLLKMSSISSVRDCTKAASEVVKMGDNPKLSGLIYPIMQTLDEEYLDVDIQFGGQDQRKIFVFAREKNPMLGYKARIEIMNPMISGLIGKKMSSSVPESKIDVLDDEKTVEKKINKADFIEGNPDNGLMEFTRYVIFTIKNDNNEKFVVERAEKFGGTISYVKYLDLVEDVENKKLHPLDLKKAVAKEINVLLKPFREDKQIRKLYELAYGK